jgi:hypothetical protein
VVLDFLPASFLKTLEPERVFYYLYRRYGPSVEGCDPEKDVANYLFTTGVTGLFLYTECSTRVRILGLFDTETADKFSDAEAHLIQGHKPGTDAAPFVQPYLQALTVAFNEQFERPVRLWDVFLTIQGKTHEAKDPVERHHTIGFGVPEEWHKDPEHCFQLLDNCKKTEPA